MGVHKKSRKFAQAKRAISLRDNRLFVDPLPANFGAFGASFSPITTDTKLYRKEPTNKEEKKPKSDDLVREAFVWSLPFSPPHCFLAIELTQSLPFSSRPQAPSSLFFQYNTALTPPYSVLVDTNFISHTIQHKLEIIPTMMDCLYAKCTPVITDCVIAELEKLGQKYRLALRVAKDPRFERIKCDHKGTYADDCLVDRIIKHRVYIVATNDRDLKRRIR